MYRCGLRASEALALMPKDLDRDVGTVNVLRGKGKKARMASMDPTAFSMVDRWLDRYRSFWNEHLDDLESLLLEEKQEEAKQGEDP